MRLLLVLAALAVPFASTPARTSSAEPEMRAGASAKPFRDLADCRRPGIHPAEMINKGEFSRLGELPPGQLVLTVFREVDGCPEPLIVRQGYGFGPGSCGSPRRARRW
jgi:hypothetical protein